MSRSKFAAIPYTNNIGQVLNPGDPVIYVGSSRQSVTVKRGKFAGVYVGNTYTYNRETRKTESREGVVALKVVDIPYTKFNWNRETKTGTHDPALRSACLPLKRVYKIVDMAAEEVVDLVTKVV